MNSVLTEAQPVKVVKAETAVLWKRRYTAGYKEEGEYDEVNQSQCNFGLFILSSCSASSHFFPYHSSSTVRIFEPISIYLLCILSCFEPLV